MSRQNMWFIVGDGIARDVITADIQRYLGPDALVRPGRNEEKWGYWITAYRNLTAEHIQDLKVDTERWRAEQDLHGAGRAVAYQDSQTHAARQDYGPTQPYHRHDASIVTTRAAYYDAPLQPTHSSNYSPLQPNHNPNSRLSPIPPRQGYTTPNYIGTDGDQHSTKRDSTAFSLFPRITRGEDWGRGRGRGRDPSVNDNPINHLSLHASKGMNGPKDQAMLDPPPASHNMSKRPGLNQAQAEAIHIEGSFSLLGLAKHSLNRTVSDITYACRWQVGGDKFCQGSPNTELTSIRMLGEGSVGKVDEVRLAGLHDNVDHFVRKQISISKQQRVADRQLKAVANEIASLMKVHVHPHIVTVIGSYREEISQRFQVAYVLTYPVGDEHLEDFFETVQKAREVGDAQSVLIYRLWLKKWFYCLSSALAFMHDCNVHHKDIKPKNVIHCRDCIYFTDFSSSRNFEAGQSTSTEGFAQATRLFAAPEACQDDPEDIQRHGSKADVFSLGLLFVEMLTVLSGWDTFHLRDFLDGYNGFAETPSRRQYWRVVDRFDDWFSSSNENSMYSRCIKPMLRKEKNERPSAAEVKDSIHGRPPWGRTMACPCKDA